MIFDSHCHYNLESFCADYLQYWQNAQEHGVTKSMVVGTDFHSSTLAAEIAEKTENLFAAIGVHPGVYQESIEKTESKLHLDDLISDIQTDEEELKLLWNPSAVKAIGETGLDYFHISDGPQRDLVIQAQQLALKMHLKLAEELHLPILIHVRDKSEQAYWDVLKILREYELPQHFVLHCVSGPISYVQQAVEMGGYIGVAGNVTYKNAEHIRDLVRSVPKDRILLETDAPYLPPQEFRGKTCEPWMISKTAEFVEKELGQDLEQIYQNTLQFFSL
jgi:TatD DNase family protein